MDGCRERFDGGGGGGGGAGAVVVTQVFFNTPPRHITEAKRSKLK